MPKEKFSFRLSDLTVQTIEEYRVKFNLKDTTEALERIVTRHKYYQSVIDRLGVSKTQTEEQLACTNRIELDGNHYCVYNVPRNVKLSSRLLETLELCVVCKTQKLGLTEKTMVRSEAQTVSEEITQPGEASPPNLSPDRSRSPVFKQDPRIRGNIYCYDGGFWVFPAKCEMCKRDTYERWSDCKTKPNGVKSDGINRVQSGSG